MSKKEEQEGIAVVSIIEAADVVKNDAKKYLLDSTIKSPENLNKLIETYKSIKIIDKATFDAAVKGSKEMKKIRTTINKNRLDVTRPFNDFKNDMISFVKPWDEQLSAAEAIINKDIQEFKDKAKAEAEKKLADRQQLFAENGFAVVAGNYVSGIIVLTPEQIAGFSEEDVKVYIDLGQKELKRIEQENARKIQEKKDFEKRLADLEAREAKLAEREKAVAVDTEIVNEKIDKIEKQTAPVQVEETPELKADILAAQKTVENAELKINEKFPPVSTPEKPGPSEENKKKAAAFVQKAGQAGFDNLRNQIIEILSDKKSKLTKTQLIEWVKNAKLKQIQK